MKKRAIRYICIAGTILFAYFMFVGILQASEAQNALLSATGGTQSRVSIGLIVWIVFCGIASFLFLGYGVMSRGGKRNWQEMIHSKKMELSMLVTGLTGALFSLLLSAVLIQSLPTYKFSSSAIASAHKPPKTETTASSASSSTASSQAPASEQPASSEEQNEPGVLDQASGVNTIEDAQTLTARLDSAQPDQSVVLAKGLASATLSQSILNKTGNSTNLDNTMRYGINAAILGTPGSTINVLGTVLNTNAVGAPAVAVSGENATASVTDSDVTALGDSSPLFMALDHGSVSVSNGLQKTLANSSPIFYVDANGSVTADSSVTETNGLASPTLLNAGTFNGSRLSMASNTSSAAVLIPGSKTTLANCAITMNGLDSDSGMEGAFVARTDGRWEKAQGLTELTLNSCSFSYIGRADHPNGAAFAVRDSDFVLNMNASMQLTGFTTLVQAERSKVTINAVTQVVYGNINGDENSEVNITLTGASGLGGSINSDQRMKTAVLHMDASSTLALSSDIYLTEFVNENPAGTNIITNGFHIYVNGQAVI